MTYRLFCVLCLLGFAVGKKDTSTSTASPETTAPSRTTGGTTAARTTHGVTTESTPSDTWVVMNGTGGYACILFQADIKLTFVNETVTIRPGNETKANGSCEGNQRIVIYFNSGDHLMITFERSHNEKNQYHFGYFNLTYSFPKTTDKVVEVHDFTDLWVHDMDVGTDYWCTSEQTVYKNDTKKHQLSKMTFSGVQLEAYRERATMGFSSTKSDCKADETSKLVPIIVGACLGGLILIVLIAYLIGRKRSRRGYESV